jgi:hypothetical protein
MKKILAASALALTLTACANPMVKEIDDTLALAEQEVAAAKKAGNIWRDTEKFIEDARKQKADAQNSGNKADYDKALGTAKKALNEAKLAQKQAADSANAKPRYPN